MKKSKLGKVDWIKAGFRALCAGGVGAIKIEVIARELKTTKGSFYWHFKDLSALQLAMLDFWQDEGTSQIIDIAEGFADPKEGLLEIVRLAISKPAAEYGGMAAEVAIRDWGRWDKLAAARVVHVDKARIDYMSELFKQIGYDAPTAKQKAQILYSVYVGATHLRANGNDVKDALLLGFARTFL